MNPKGLFDVGVRLLGIYFFVDALASLPVLGAAVDAYDQAVPTPQPDYLLFASLSIAVYAGAGMLLFFFGDRLFQYAEKSTDVGSESTKPVAVAIQLIGLFFCVDSAYQLLSAVTTWTWSRHGAGFAVSQYLPHILVFALAAYLVTNANRVASWIDGVSSPRS